MKGLFSFKDLSHFTTTVSSVGTSSWHPTAPLRLDSSCLDVSLSAQPASPSPYTGWTHVEGQPLLFNQIVNAGGGPWSVVTMDDKAEVAQAIVGKQVYGNLQFLHQDLQACKFASGLQSGWQCPAGPEEMEVVEQDWALGPTT